MYQVLIFGLVLDFLYSSNIICINQQKTTRQAEKNRTWTYIGDVAIFVCWSKPDEFSNETRKRLAQQNVTDAQSSVSDLNIKYLHFTAILLLMQRT